MMGPLYAGSLAAGSALHAVYPDGQRVAVPVDDWRGPLLPGDSTVLDRCAGPALDIGCGPGRFAAALAARGVPCLGIDVTAEAVRLARAAGASAVQRSVFDDVPGGGGWSSALLVDGNIGIGGSPRVLLRRVRQLLGPGGAALVEVDPPGSRSELVALRLVSGGAIGSPFPWASVAVQDLGQVAGPAGLSVREIWEEAGRWFARLSAG